MKRITAFLLCLMIVIILAGCGGSKTDSKNADIKVVTTIFPIYDWLRETAKDDVDLKIDLLLDNGVDMHSFQPTAKDIMDISNCDIFIYVGGESDKWVKDVIAQADNKNMTVINLMDIIGSKAKEEELKEGMQGEEEEGKEEEEAEKDEHVWLSLQNTKLFVTEIAAALAKADSQHSEAILSNASAYRDKLTALDAQYREAVDNAKVKTLLFGDRFPFRYLTDDYGLDYYAAFLGCSAETEASFETIMFLADKVDELKLPAIMQIETSDGSIAKTVRDNTESKDQEILTLNSMQNVTSEKIGEGETYLGIMESNLEVLKKALG